MRKMEKFKQFMTIEEYTKLTSQAMSTHMKKPEVIKILTVVAAKYCEMGDLPKALERANRAEVVG